MQKLALCYTICFKLTSMLPSSTISLLSLTVFYFKDYYPTKEIHEIIKISSMKLHKLPVCLYNMFQTNFNASLLNLFFFFPLSVSVKHNILLKGRGRENKSIILLHKLEQDFYMF